MNLVAFILLLQAVSEVSDLTEMPDGITYRGAACNQLLVYWWHHSWA
jgi:hypothetical protein